MKCTFKTIILFLGIGIMPFQTIKANDGDKQETEEFLVYKGEVVDAYTNKPMVFASVSVQDENVATVSNSEGKFSLKLPKDSKATHLIVSFIGYKNLKIALNRFKPESYLLLKMEQISVSLSEVKVSPKNAKELIEKVMEEREKNYMTTPALMTTFYREMIKKRRTYVALSEAVLQVYKQPYNNAKADNIKLFKGRKSSYPQKMDTLLFKLKSGAYSILQLDVVKNPYLLIDREAIEKYDYQLENITKVNGKLTYVIDFKQKPHIEQALFFGKIYIDADKFAISSMLFSFNVEDRNEAIHMFVKKKPLGAKIYPTSTHYAVNYHEQNGKWVFNYARSEIAFKVNWKRKLFSTTYTVFNEIATTNWQVTDKKPFKISERLKYGAILNDKVSDFYDKDFWGNYNIIEPEKTINTAIKKIKKKLDRMEN